MNFSDDNRSDKMASTAVVERDGPAPMVPSDDDRTLAMIERLAANPDFDVEKLKALLDMQERVLDRNAKAEFFAELAVMQPDLPVVGRHGTISVPAKDGKTGHDTPYARWEDVNAAIGPILGAHGFALSFRTATSADGRIEITGILSHRGGHQEQTSLTLMHDSTGSKNAVQAIGSSVSYGKRYTAGALLNLTSRGEDDDGKAAGDEGPSEVFARTVEEINGYEMLADLKAWKRDQAEGVQKMVSDDEWKQIMGLCNRRAAALKAGKLAEGQ